MCCVRTCAAKVLFLDEAAPPSAWATDACVCVNALLVRRVGRGGGATMTEVSMIDVDIFKSVTGVLSLADHARRTAEGRGRERRDPFGDVHVLLFGDFKRSP